MIADKICNNPFKGAESSQKIRRILQAIELDRENENYKNKRTALFW